MRTRQHPLLSLGLALGVHALLAGLLLWGFEWELPQPKAVQLELWSARQVAVRTPETRPEPERRRPAPRPAKPAVQDEPLDEAEINRRKPEKKPEPRKEPEKKPEPKPEAKAPEKTPEKAPDKKPEAKPSGKPANTPRVAPPQPGEEDDPLLAAARRGTGSSKAGGPDKGALIDEYRAKLTQRIRSKVVEPPGLSGNPVAEFSVTVLSTMVVSDVSLTRSSGDPQWDDAAEKAIWMNKQLPALPQGLSWGPDLRTMRIKLCPKSCP